MLLPKSIRKFIAVFRGDVSPVLILLSVALGLWFGFTPGWYGIHVCLLVLVLALNVHLGIFIMFAGLGRAFAYAAAPLMYHVGVLVQDNLGGLLNALAALPVVGLTDFSRYSVAGAVLLGPIVGIGAGLLLGQAVTRFRKAWLTLDQSSEAFRTWQNKSWVRWLDWLLLGKRTKDVKQVLEQKPKLIRIPGIIVSVVVLAASGVGLQMLSGDALQGLAASQLTAANGAQVDLASFKFSPFGGRVEAEGIEVTDPANPSNNRIAIGSLKADAGLWPLLRGKLIIDEVQLGEVQFDSPRKSPGEVVDPNAVGEEAEEEPFEPSQFALPTAEQLAKLEDYFQKSQNINEKIKEGAKWLPAGDKDEQKPPPPSKPESYLGYLMARAPQSPTPRLIVSKATLEGVLIPSPQIGKSNIVCTNLSDAPEAAGLPVTVDIQSTERPSKLKIVYHYDRSAGGATIEGRLEDVDLAELQQQQLSGDNPVRFEGGTATADISGTATRETVDLKLKVQTQQMKASAGKAFFGVDPSIANEALQALENLTTELRLVGPVGQARLAFDSGGLKAALEQAAVDAGKKKLAGELDKAIGDKLPEGSPKSEEILDDPLGGGKKALEGFLGGGKKDGE